jgi:hypothetical protein
MYLTELKTAVIFSIIKSASGEGLAIEHPLSFLRTKTSMIPSNPDSHLHLPDSVRYALFVILALLVGPAFIQGMMAFFHAFTHTLEITIVALGLGGGGFWLWHRDRRQQQQHASMQGMLDLFVSEGKPFKLFDFVQKVGLPEAIVKPYLERVSRELKTLVEVEDRGEIYYSVRSPNFHESPHPVTSESISREDLPSQSMPDGDLKLEFLPDQTHPETTASPKSINRPFIQAELARRLNVSASTIGKRKLKPDFTEWVRSKDPEGMGWRYSQVTKQFYPQP